MTRDESPAGEPTDPGSESAFFISGRALAHQFCDITGSTRSDFFPTLDGRNGLPEQAQVKTHRPSGTKAPTDLLWFSNTALLLRPRAIDALGPVLTDGLLLPLRAGREQIYAFCPAHFSEALDQNASVIRRFPSGRVMEIEQLVLDRTLLQDADVFKLAAYPRGPLIFSQQFVDRVALHDITGVEFTQIDPS